MNRKDVFILSFRIKIIFIYVYIHSFVCEYWIIVAVAAVVSDVVKEEKANTLCEQRIFILFVLFM